MQNCKVAQRLREAAERNAQTVTHTLVHEPTVTHTVTHRTNAERQRAYRQRGGQAFKDANRDRMRASRPQKQT